LQDINELMLAIMNSSTVMAQYLRQITVQSYAVVLALVCTHDT